MLTYVADLKKPAAYCNFAANLNDALRDRLACGLRNVQILKRLLSEAKLKYSKALEIAVVMETAIHDASKLQSEFHPEQSRVDKISDNSQTTPVLPHSRTPLLTLVIGAEETRTQHTIADSRTRHAIIVGR